MSSRGGPQHGTRRQRAMVVKRLADIVLSLIVAVLGLPLFLLIALLVKITSPGSIFFVQDRAGLDQRAFRMIKFRTMTGVATGASLLRWTADDDARITPIGRLLRDYGLDELPQVINILRGDMSIVGPRPPLPTQAERYDDFQRKMFQMRPGVLSLAAIEGRRSISMDRRIALHVKYVQNWSLRLDLLILWRTFFIVLRRRDATDLNVS